MKVIIGRKKNGGSQTFVRVQEHVPEKQTVKSMFRLVDIEPELPVREPFKDDDGDKDEKAKYGDSAFNFAFNIHGIRSGTL